MEEKADANTRLMEMDTSDRGQGLTGSSIEPSFVVAISFAAFLFTLFYDLLFLGFRLGLWLGRGILLVPGRLLLRAGDSVLTAFRVLGGIFP